MTQIRPLCDSLGWHGALSLPGKPAFSEVHTTDKQCPLRRASGDYTQPVAWLVMLVLHSPAPCHSLTTLQATFASFMLLGRSPCICSKYESLAMALELWKDVTLTKHTLISWHPPTLEKHWAWLIETLV